MELVRKVDDTELKPVRLPGMAGKADLRTGQVIGGVHQPDLHARNGIHEIEGGGLHAGIAVPPIHAATSHAPTVHREAELKAGPGFHSVAQCGDLNAVEFLRRCDQAKLQSCGMPGETCAAELRTHYFLRAFILARYATIGILYHLRCEESDLDAVDHPVAMEERKTQPGVLACR